MFEVAACWWLFAICDLHGFLFEPIAEFVVDFGDDFFAGGSEVAERFGGFVDENEGSFATDADAMEELTFESGLFDEPSGADFVAFWSLADGKTFVGDALGFVFADINIFEKRARASFFDGVGELVGTDLTNDVSDALRGEVSEIVVGNVAFDGIVEGAGHLPWMKR